MSHEIITDNPIRFESLYGAQYRSIFTGWAETESPFRSREWTEVLILGAALSLDNAEFTALADAAQSLGDHEFAATTMNSIPLHAIAVIGEWDRARSVMLEAESLIDVVDYAVLGKSAQWGAVAYHEGFTRVAGDASFMRRFLDPLGGIEDVQGRFMRFARDEWRHVSEDYKRSVLNSVGW